MKIIVCVLGLLLFFQFLMYRNTTAVSPVPHNLHVSATPAIEVQAFATPSGWGYSIFIEGKPYIRQDNIPSLPGNQGFSSREKALKAGNLVAYKIKNAILPPSIFKHELDSLQLIRK